MKLSNLRINKKAKVVSINILNQSVKRHILEMGLVRGTIIRVCKIAPMGDPISIELRGYELAIRKEEARFIEVEVIWCELF